MTHPLFRYFGSKWLMSLRYPAPRYATVIEPFAGSACYSLRHSVRHAVLFETNPRVAALWRYLIQVTTEEILALPCETLVVGEDIHERCAHEGFSDGAAELIARWQRVGLNGCGTVSKWNNANSGLWSESAKRRIAETLPVIRGWEVYDRSATWDDNAEATWFIDPPYQSQANVYRSPPLDYSDLGEYCKSRKGQVIVCEQDGATWLPFQPLAVNVNGRRKRTYVEVFWTNDNKN